MKVITESGLGFKVLSLKVWDHKILGSNTFLFANPSDKENELYLSVIIGANGTGKSEIFRMLLTVLRTAYLNFYQGKQAASKVAFELTYANHGEVYVLGNAIRFQNGALNSFASLILKKGSDTLDLATQLDIAKSSLPLAVVGNSFLLMDKFIFPRNNEFKIYSYLGVRNRPQQASTRSYIKKIVELVVKGVEEFNFLNGLQQISQLFGKTNQMFIRYETRLTTKFFTGRIKPNQFDEYFSSIEAQYKKSEKQPPFKLSNYKRIKTQLDSIQQICDFLNDLVNNHRLESKQYRKSSRSLIYNVTDSESHTEMRSEYQLLKWLGELQLLSTPTILMGSEAEYGLEESSSGEFHLVSTFIGLMASIKPYSLIMIDEPEISLHPNWQMQFIDILRSIFKNEAYRTCHFIVATHSHFIVSDLPGKTSHLLGLKKEEGKLEVVKMNPDIDTFGWSAEEVLYKIFNVRTSRNFYIENNLRELLYLISIKSIEKNKIQELLDALTPIMLNERDPLNQVIQGAKKYLMSI
ncbi:MAG: AAA family ATPase [Cyclobacteriaceae bacterium]